MEQMPQGSSRKFSLEERFKWCSEGERRLIDKALEHAVDEDIELYASDGQLLKCHRCILSAASPYFNAMFKSGMRECRGQVDLHFPGDLLASLLRFLYDGRLEVNDATFEQTFLMYHLFELRSALAFMADLLSDSAEPDNAVELYDMAMNFDIPQLRISVTKLLLAVPILEMQFDKFPLDLLASLLDSDELRVNHEGQVVELVLTWVKADIGARSTHQEALLNFVRLPHLRLVEVDAWREKLAHLDLFNILTDSTDWLADVNKKMLSKRLYSDIHMHGFWAEDSLCEYSFETMRHRKMDQPLWMFDTSQYSIMCSFLGKEPKMELDSCNQDYLSYTSIDVLVVREDWTKRPSFVVGPDLHISFHDTLRRVADLKGGWGSPDYDLAFLKVPLSANGLTSRRSQCKRRSFNFEYFKSRICCATEYEAHDIKVFDLSETSEAINLECSISLEFDIGVTAWVKKDTLYLYLVDRVKDVFDSTDGDEEPPKMHFISGYSITNNFDKTFQHHLELPEAEMGYPKDVRAMIIRDTIYIIYKAVPKYKSPAEEGLYVYRYEEDFQTVVRVDRFDVLRQAKCDRFPTSGAIYERDLITLLPTDMVPCEHTTLLEEFCHRCSLNEELTYDPLRLASLRKYLL
ncbi:hypothetical protein BIW11_10390 [Tropilaelaps mercedesae]|uniref:BTB domain-containing protein n=1 Tax=Tropilaelaps mercedesae TaxID=418985 RepID=A0A1V9XG75_9ACAR|nr:hypothetical protein BIW11_10390 [Tropilaelaps mercedesae]